MLAPLLLRLLSLLLLPSVLSSDSCNIDVSNFVTTITPQLLTRYLSESLSSLSLSLLPEASAGTKTQITMMSF